jgi:hypothetical protein
LRVLLVDADSTIPNIALCKLSTFHKSMGDDVKLITLNLPYYPNRIKHHYYIGNKYYDKVYCSVIFEGNIQYIHGDNITFGGTGYNLSTELNDRCEHQEIDYSLYPNNNISYGFITRGCIRKCSFCKVPEKEGNIRQVNTIDNIIRHKQVKFLDNNILSFPNHYDILSELSEKQIKCNFNQGLDIRLVNSENSKLLSRLNYLKEYTFALDNVSLIPLVDYKIKNILTWAKDWIFRFFVYIHPNLKISDTIRRIEYLKSIKCIPYVMRDISCWNSKSHEFYVDIASYTNQVNIFKKMDFKTFMEKRYSYSPDKPRIKRNIELYYDNIR